MNDDICNLLPQGIVTQVCLKRKWKIKSYVYSEAVRPNIMQGTLNFLKLNVFGCCRYKYMHEVTGETIPEMSMVLKAMLNNGKAIDSSNQ